MHSYAVDSPEAISRILALTMIVDGHVSPSEVRTMHAAALLREINIDADTFDSTLRHLCEDLLDAAACRHAGMVEFDPALLDALLAEIADQLLQVCLWKTMLDIIEADGHLDGRETTLVRRAARAWFGHGRADGPTVLASVDG